MNVDSICSLVGINVRWSIDVFHKDGVIAGICIDICLAGVGSEYG